MKYETYRYPNATADSTLKHTILVWTTAAAGGPFDKLLLVIEGIDAANESGPESYYALGAVGGQPLFPTAQALGADIAILNFGDGGRDMRANAAVVDAAVSLIRDKNTALPRSIDVVGVSMGGVVARYALAKMDQEGRAYGIARFVSVDAPQRGAVIDGQLQHDIRIGIDPAEQPPALSRLASLQLLRLADFDPNSPGPNSYHNLFYTELRAQNNGWGYPRRIENVGVSFGLPTANPNAGRWLRLEVSGLCNLGEYWVSACDDRDYFIGGATDEPGSYLPEANTAFYGRKAWGLISYYLQRFTNPTFIPYTSALDIATGTNPAASRFHAPVITATTRPAFHDEILPEVSTALLRRLGYTLPPPPNVAITGPTSVPTGETGYWRAMAPDPGAGYQITWEYKITSTGCGGARSAEPANGRLAQPDSIPVAERMPPTPQNIPPCGAWTYASSSGGRSVFSYRTTGRLQLRATATGGGQSVVSPIYYACIGACDGGSVDALSSSEDPSPARLSAADLSRPVGPTFWLSAGRPNPFGSGAGRPSKTVLRFSLPEALPAQVVVYDALGREVARPFDGFAEAGEMDAVFDGSSLPSGVYVVRLTAGSNTAAQRITLAR